MKHIDIQDVLLLVGVTFVVGGVGAWSKPAASILLGIFCLFAVVQIERGKRVKGTDGASKQ